MMRVQLNRREQKAVRERERDCHFHTALCFFSTATQYKRDTGGITRVPIHRGQHMNGQNNHLRAILPNSDLSLTHRRQTLQAKANMGKCRRWMSVETEPR